MIYGTMRSAVVVRLVTTELPSLVPQLRPIESTRVRSAVCLGLIATLGLAAAAFTVSWSNGFSSLDSRMKRDASGVCKGFVKHRLKTPTKARFSGYDSADVVTRANSYTVTGRVTLPSAGQQTYTCTVRPTNGKWVLDALVGID